MPTRDGKTCSHCQKLLPLGNFSRNSTTADGLQTWCKQCIKEKFTYSVDTITVTQKVCGHCKVLKPSGEYNKNKARKDGLSVQCKTCLKKMTNSKPRTLTPLVNEKVCSTCGELKAANEFFATTRHRDGLTYACKSCETSKKKRRKVTTPTVSHKLCSKCNEDKAAEHFHADPYTSTGLCRYCRDCVLAQRWSNRVLQPTISEKRCSFCNTLKPAVDFTRNTFTSDGLASWCRTCTVQHTKRKRCEETAQKALEQLASGFGPTKGSGSGPSGSATATGSAGGPKDSSTDVDVKDASPSDHDSASEPLASGKRESLAPSGSTHSLSPLSKMSVSAPTRGSLSAPRSQPGPRRSKMARISARRAPPEPIITEVVDQGEVATSSLPSPDLDQPSPAPIPIAPPSSAVKPEDPSPLNPPVSISIPEGHDPTAFHHFTPLYPFPIPGMHGGPMPTMLNLELPPTAVHPWPMSALNPAMFGGFRIAVPYHPQMAFPIATEQQVAAFTYPGWHFLPPTSIPHAEVTIPGFAPQPQRRPTPPPPASSSSAEEDSTRAQEPNS